MGWGQTWEVKTDLGVRARDRPRNTRGQTWGSEQEADLGTPEGRSGGQREQEADLGTPEGRPGGQSKRQT